ncbi:ASN_HP2_G0020920.mRNA.1.CDS.1 [Saccharomyces cerevisiae]|nr:ASN_HP2_G0020920.mRNA.1.CDS.1 [Saccharomyces cerevisiae]CAI6485296.1 ASN_HP2_G0020920.mRNA.1.CDS.1 [Saccharomyces cerevisiae]
MLLTNNIEIMSNVCYVYNKIDAVISLEEVDKLAREPNDVMSVKWIWGCQDVVEEIWYQMNLSRVYTKKRGVRPVIYDPPVVRNNSRLHLDCHGISQGFQRYSSNTDWFWVLLPNASPQNGAKPTRIDDDEIEFLYSRKRCIK